MKRAIVTGASGFIGFSLLQELLCNDYEVLAVVHSKESEHKLESLRNPNLSIAICDIPDFSSLCLHKTDNYDVFFHMAWEGVSGEKNRSLPVQRRNVSGAIAAVKAAADLHCKKFVGAGSIHEVECMKEMEQAVPIQNYANYYKTAKLAAHYYCKLESQKRGLGFFWPRLTNTFGAGELSERMLVSTIQKLLRNEIPQLTEGTQLYNFIYITDAARAYRMIAERGVAYHNYVIGGEEIKPLKEFLLEVQQIVNPNVPLGFGKYRFQGVCLAEEDFSTESLRKETGFQTHVKFEEGINITKDFLQQQVLNSQQGGICIENDNGCNTNV